MTRGLVARLAGLESRRSTSECRTTIRFGHLKRLPRSYTGERHVVVARELPSQNGQEWVEFEEVPGPGPKPPEVSLPRGGRPIAARLDVMFVSAYPLPGECSVE
jgi:hypothetical protein